MATLGQLLIDLGCETASLFTGLDKADKRIKQFAGSAGKVGEALRTMFSQVVGGLGLIGIEETIRHRILLFDEYAKKAKALGTTTEFLSSLSYGASLSGAKFEDVVKGLRVFENELGKAQQTGSESEATFARLGVSAKSLADMPLDKSFSVVADALARMGNQLDKEVIAQELFGRGVIQMLPLLNEGAGGIEKFRQEAQRLGLVVGGDTARASERAHDALFKLGEVLKNALAKGIVAVIEPLTQMIEGFMSVVSSITAAWSAMSNTERTIIKVVVGMGIMVVVIPKVIAAISMLVNSIKTLITTSVIAEAVTGGPKGLIKALAMMAAGAAAAMGAVAVIDSINAKINESNKEDTRKKQASESIEAKIKEQEAAAKFADQTREKLEREVATYGKSESAILAYDMAKKKVALTDRTALYALQDKLDKLKSEEEATKKVREEYDKIKEKGKSLTESLRSPWEKYADTLAELQKLLDANAISLETYNRAFDKAQDALTGNNKQALGSAIGSGYLEYGSRQYYEVVKQLAVQNEQKNIQQRIADNTSKATGLLADIKTNTSKSDSEVEVIV